VIHANPEGGVFMNSKLRFIAAAGALLTAGYVAYADSNPGDAPEAPMTAAKLFARPEDAPYVTTAITPPCNTLVGTRGDPSKEASTFLTKMTSGCIVSWHWHHATEELVVLKGTAVAQMKGGKPVILRPASYAQLPTKHVHRFRCASKETCYIFVVGDAPFDVNFVNEDGKAMTAAESIAYIQKVGHTGW
jgi:quercetin dioxygenase-like cupin family protein